MDKKRFAEFLGEVETYLSVLAPGFLSSPLLEWAAALRDQAIVTSGVEAYEAAHGESCQRTPSAQSVAKAAHEVKLKAVVQTDGFNAWRVLAFWFQARSMSGSMSLLTLIMNPDMARDFSDMMNKLDLLVRANQRL